MENNKLLTKLNRPLIMLSNSNGPGPPEQGVGWGGGGRVSAPYSVLIMCPFFEELFKCAFFENIKSEIVNIQQY